MAPFIKHQTGFIWAIPKALAGRERVTARLPQRLKCCLLSICKPMRATCFLAPTSNPLTSPEHQSSCYPPKKCTHYTISLPVYPTRAQGRRHSLPTVLAISTAAVLCGREGYKGIWDWAKALGPKGRERFRCRYVKGGFQIPSESIFRDVLIRVEPAQLDLALQQWHKAHGQDDDSLAIDGKTMKNAIDKEGRQTHIMSAIGHQSKACYTQKKSVLCR